MKRPISILLLIAHLAILSKPFFPLVDFALNQDFIARVLCINRDEPASACQGKCYLKKELQKANHEDPAQQKSNDTRRSWDLLSPALTFYGDGVDSPVLNRSAFIEYYLFSVREFSLAKPTPPPRNLV